MLSISKPGIFTDVLPAAYFADLCPRPSLTQSVAKLLLDRSPLHAWYAHPKLNPDYVRNEETKFDLGNTAHQLLIGRGRDVMALPYNDWRSGKAKQAREEASLMGKLAVLEHQYERARNMVVAAREQLDDRGLDDLFWDGDGEVVAAWNEGEIWLRQMIDWLTPGNLTMADYKTTGESAAPQALARKMVNDGWHIQAAMAERGLDVLDAKSAGRRRYLFVVQEDTRPYALTVVEISESVMTLGRKMLQFAVRIWTHCMQQNIWPDYPHEVQRPEFPGWAETQWLDREMAAQRPNDLIMAG
jgi:hypothetical protein